LTAKRREVKNENYKGAQKKQISSAQPGAFRNFYGFHNAIFDNIPKYSGIVLLNLYFENERI
jgi:hypothetical protein